MLLICLVGIKFLEIKGKISSKKENIKEVQGEEYKVEVNLYITLLLC